MADSPWPRVQALTLFRTMRRRHIEPDAVCYEARGAHAAHGASAHKLNVTSRLRAMRATSL